ncbi:MAG TPA: UDP-N-acetylmuramoyl-tripeptide--D-alanyl-D-alanine ligase [Alphaproteobacteria bacterium]
MSVFFLGLAFAFFAYKRILTYMHIFQQEEYDSRRLFNWLIRTKTVDRKATLCLFLLAIPATLLPFMGQIFAMVAAIVLAAIAWIEPDPRLKGKKKLTLTARATRIIVSTGILLFIAMTALVSFEASLLVWIALIQSIPFMIMLGNAILSPWESVVQKKFWDEAHAKLLDLKPITIGITGSFGKTSTKHILAHMLSAFAPTLATPGSVNTPMGVTRVVRETLTPNHKFFVVEMGAYGAGSIKRLCDLAPPDVALITTIGHAHYERYKSLDAVARAKFELPEAVNGKSGYSVLGSDVMDFDYARQFVHLHRNSVTLVGSRNDDDAQILEVGQSADGLFARVTWREREYRLQAPLFGVHHAANMALAFVAACRLGMEPEQAIMALRTTPQIRHRLEVIHQGSGAIVIDDAYNSNPAGFAAALEVLSLLGQKRRRILISPGMVELGELHDEEHAKVGTIAAQHCDVILPVAPARIPTMIEAFRTFAPHKQVIPCATFQDAQNWLSNNMQYSDIVLLENDLPDLYERSVKL